MAWVILVLNREDVDEFTILPLCHEVIAVPTIDELSSDTYARSRLAHCLQHEPDAEILGVKCCACRPIGKFAIHEIRAM